MSHEQEQDCGNLCPPSSENNDEKLEINFRNVQEDKTTPDSNIGHLLEVPGKFIGAQLNSEKGLSNLEPPYEHLYGVIEMLQDDSENSPLEEDIERRFQDLAFAFRTDSMTLEKRHAIRKRLRDLAEINIEREINLMKTKLNNVIHVCTDSNSYELLCDLKKQLDIILTMASYLSGMAEAYGFVQNEDRMMGAVSLIIKQMEYIEGIQTAVPKSTYGEKSVDKRIQQLPDTIEGGDIDTETLRRRPATHLKEGVSKKRRASIAGGICPAYNSHVPCNRISNIVTKKTSLNQTCTMKLNFNAGDCMCTRDTPNNLQTRIDNRSGGFGIKFLYDPAHDHCTEDESDESSDFDADVSAEENVILNTRVLRKTPFESSPRKISVSSEALNIIDALGRVLKWNILAVRNSRFQFPKNVHQYVPFIITWYFVILTAVIFGSGFIAGFNGCVVS